MSQGDDFRAWWKAPQADVGLELSISGADVRRIDRAELRHTLDMQAAEEDPESLHLGGGYLRSTGLDLPVEVVWVGPDPDYDVYFQFADGSEARVARGDEPGPARTLDRGVALLEPIGLREFTGVESIIGKLYEAAGTGRLSEADERRILELAQLIEWQRRETVPDETPRWQLIGVVRTVLLRLAKEVPVAFAANEIALKLHEVGWHDLAASLTGIGR